MNGQPVWLLLITWLVFIPRGFSQMCAGDFNRRGGWVLLPQRLPVGAKDKAAEPFLPAVRLRQFHEGVLREELPWNRDETHRAPTEDWRAPWAEEGETLKTLPGDNKTFLTVKKQYFSQSVPVSWTLTGNSTVQWFWFTWGLSPELSGPNSWASQKGRVEDAKQRQHGAALQCQAGECALPLAAFWIFAV